jgi:hypothetical protein
LSLSTGQITTTGKAVGITCGRFTDHLSNSPALRYLDDCGFFSPTNTA